MIGIAASGATPVLADVDPLTLTLDLGSVRAAVGPLTRAIVPVHLYGRRAEVEPFLELGFPVIGRLPGTRHGPRGRRCHLQLLSDEKRSAR